jgi:hypothetical protein
MAGELVLYNRKFRNSDLTSRKIPRPHCLPDNFSGFPWKKYPRFLEKETQGRWGFHSLRRRFAAYQHSRGMPFYLLMERLEHSKLSTTQIYLRSLPSFCPEQKNNGSALRLTRWYLSGAPGKNRTCANPD